MSDGGVDETLTINGNAQGFANADIIKRRGVGSKHNGVHVARWKALQAKAGITPKKRFEPWADPLDHIELARKKGLHPSVGIADGNNFDPVEPRWA